jgi:hypothetical protein
MAQRLSGFARKPDELYETPGWVAEVLVPHLPRRPKCVLEPAPGSGRMVQALAGAFGVSTRVIAGGASFLDTGALEPAVEAIVTNPHAHGGCSDANSARC